MPLESLGKLIVAKILEDEDEVEESDNEAGDTLEEYESDKDASP